MIALPERSRRLAIAPEFRPQRSIGKEVVLIWVIPFWKTQQNCSELGLEGAVTALSVIRYTPNLDFLQLMLSLLLTVNTENCNITLC